MAERNESQMAKQISKSKIKSQASKWKGKSNRERSDTSYDTKTTNIRSDLPNDPSWYTLDDQLLKDTSSFAYGYPLGNPINYGPNASTDMNRNAIPGIMTIYTMPAIGEALSANDPVNVAMRNVYSFVRHANSGHANYDAPDLMIYLLAMDSIYSYIAYLKRIYGTFLTYSYTNRYIARSLVEAQEVDYVDMQANLSDLRQLINTLVVKAGSMVVPAIFPLYQRHYMMYSDYFTDNDSDKAQMYMYMPEGFYKFALDSDGAGMLQAMRFTRTTMKSVQMSDQRNTGHLLKITDLRYYGNELLNVILENEDMNIMSGDILKAYGENGVYKLTLIPEDYTIMPKFSSEILDQINNATLMGRTGGFLHASDPEPSFEAISIKQAGASTLGLPHSYITQSYNTYIVSKDKIIQKPLDQVFNSNKLVNFDHGNVTPADTMVATRLTNIGTSSSTSVRPAEGTYYLKDFYSIDGVTGDLYIVERKVPSPASEVATFAKIYYNANYEGETQLFISEDIYTAIPSTFDMSSTATSTSTVDHSLNDFRRATFISMFNRHPRVAQCVFATDGTDTYGGDAVGFLGDINYYTVLSIDNLKEMNAAAMLGLFRITQYGLNTNIK